MSDTDVRTSDEQTGRAGRTDEARHAVGRDALASDPELDAPVDADLLERDAPSEGLDRVSGFLRDEPEPEIDWRVSEARLLAALDASGAPRRELRAVGAPRWGLRAVGAPPGAARRLGLAVAATVALAAGALGLYATQRAEPGRVAESSEAPLGSQGVAAGSAGPLASSLTSSQAAQGAPRTVLGAELPRLASGAHDARALRQGERVVSSEAVVTLGITGPQAELARFTLAPRSRVRIDATADADGRGQVLVLEEGAVHAEVSPELAAAESTKRAGADGVFAVRVDGVTVSVRGTAFTVTRTGPGFEVDVSRGTVAVAASPEAARTLLRAPARAAYGEGATHETALARDGAPAWVAAIESELGGPKVGAPTIPHLTELSLPGQASPPARGPLPHGPRPDHREAGAPKGPSAGPALASSAPSTRALDEASVRGGLRRCFDDHRSSAPDAARVSVSSTLRLTLRADGTVASARFDPPLAPAVMTCAQGVLFGGAFAPGTANLSLALSF
jgi:ferric-dicitrate binding protein FerR (iron transport regulator)